MRRLLMLLFCAALLWPVSVAAQMQSEVSAYQQFRNNPSVISGEAFLNEYPYGKYADKVSDEMCRMLSDGLNAYSVEADYERALKYARSKQSERYAETKIAAAKKAKKKFEADPVKYASVDSGSTNAKLRPSGSGFFALGASFFMDFSDTTLGLGGAVNMRFGTPKNRFNATVGVKYMSTGCMQYVDEAIEYQQLAVPMVLRFNIWRVRIFDMSMYLGAGASYNCNMAVKYKCSDDYQERMYKPMANRNTFSGIAQLGFGFKYWDCNFYLQYDLKPVAVDAKKELRYGFEFGFYLPFKRR